MPLVGAANVDLRGQRGGHVGSFTVELGDPAGAALTGGTADERGQAFLIAEISNSRVTLSLTRTPPPSSAAFQVTL